VRVAEQINLTIAAARHVLGILSPDERDLGDLHDIELPDVDDAAWIMLEHHIGAIAHGRIEPEPGVRLVIEEVFRPAGLARRSRRSAGDSHGLVRLVELQDSYDDILGYERRNGARDLRRSQVDALVVAAAQDWMHLHAIGRTRS
jgi:hypothetical protein